MVTDIEAKDVSVGKLYGPDFIFEIPIYQRPLSWGKDNFDQLFEDIFDAMTSNEKQYFLGSIILQEDTQEKDKYDLVDGQQRITALAILMAVIRDNTSNTELQNNLKKYLYQEEDRFKKIPAEVRIVSWQDLRKMFESYVYEVGGTQKFAEDFNAGVITYNDTQDPTYHLYEAISIFTEKLSERFEDTGQLEDFVTYLLNNVYMVYIKTNSLTSAFRLFNVLNTRGLPLNTSDILKSENIGAIRDSAVRSHYAQVWMNLENSLGREELENVIAFVRTIRTKEKAKLGIYEEYRRIIFEKGYLHRGTEFIDYLKDIADIHTNKVLDADIQGRGSEKNEYKNIVTLLRRFVPFSDWIPPLLLFCKKFGRDEYLRDFVSKLEKKVIVEWIAGFSPTERITSLNRVAKAIEAEEQPVTVVDKLLFYFYKGDEKAAGRVPRSIDFSNKELVKSNLLSKLNDSQFYSIYGGKLAKYILLRIDMTCWDLENFPGYPGTITVEHVLPQSPSEGSEWVSSFTEDERKQLTHTLGNLVLLSGRKNSKAQNYDFTKKKEVYFKEKSTPFRITQWLEQKDKWTAKELGERHQMLIEDAKRIFLDY